MSYKTFERFLNHNEEFNYLLESPSLNEAFAHLDSVSLYLQNLNGSNVDGARSAFEKWGSELPVLEQRSARDDTKPWRFVFDAPISKGQYIHDPIVQICSGEPAFYRFVMTFKPQGIEFKQDFDCVTASPNLSEVHSESRRMTLAERERQDSEYAVQRIAVLGPARVFIHGANQIEKHVQLVTTIERQMNNFTSAYQNNLGQLEPQSRFRLTNGGWAGMGEGSTGVPAISSFFGIPEHGIQKESVTVMPSLGAYDRVQGIAPDNYYEVPGTWGDDSRYLVGYSTSLLIFEPYGFWTGIELHNGLAQRKPVAVIVANLEEVDKQKGYKEITIPLKDGSMGCYRKYDDAGKAAMWINRCWNIEFLNKFLQMTSLPVETVKQLLKLRDVYLAGNTTIELLIHDSLIILGSNPRQEHAFKIALVQHIGLAIRFLSEEDRNNFNLVFLAIKQNPNALESDSLSLQRDSNLRQYISLPDINRAACQNEYLDVHPELLSCEHLPIEPSIPGAQLSVIKSDISGWRDVKIPENPYKELMLAIDRLEQYGEGLSAMQRYESGRHTLVFAAHIRYQIDSLIYKRKTLAEVEKNINALLRINYKLVDYDRTSRDIFAHFILACTGIGLVVMCLSALCYGTFFLHKTDHQHSLSLGVDVVLAHLNPA